jgi:molybdate transport system substrate-binding protein
MFRALPMTRAGCLLTAVALAAALAGCGSSKPARQSGTITVLAAASLTEAFGALAEQFEAAHPGVTVRLSFGASSALALQIEQGAPADVFASASGRNMDQVVSAGGAGTSTDFARNVMEIAVPPSNPAHLAALADLARAGVKVALCQPQVPCGTTAQQVFDNAGVRVTPVTLEADVKSVLTKVETDEVDAGVVYVTDVRSAGSKVTGIPIDSSVNAATDYPIAALTGARNPAGAAAFVSYVLSAAGQQVLTADGFEQP